MMVQTKDEVFRIISDHQDALFSFGVRRCSLFGSFLREEISPKSDVDLLVEFKPSQKTFLNFANLRFFLEELLGRRVELITPESLNRYIGPYILSEVEYVITVG